MAKRLSKRQLERQLERQVKQRTHHEEGETARIHTFSEQGHFVELVDNNNLEWNFPVEKQLNPPVITESEEAKLTSQLSEESAEIEEEQTRVRAFAASSSRNGY